MIKIMTSFFSVHAAYVPVCLFQQSFQSNLLSFIEYSMKLFNADSPTSLMLRDSEKEADLYDIELSRKNIVDFVSKRIKIAKVFKRSASTQ